MSELGKSEWHMRLLENVLSNIFFETTVALFWAPICHRRPCM